MMNPYLSDLLHQPQALQDTLESLKSDLNLQSYTRRLQVGDFQTVILTGMGSSFHALHPLWLSLLARGVPAYKIETSELIHSAPALLNERTLLIAVSQSGRSAEILRLLEMPRATLLAVTNTPDSPLAGQADLTLLTQAGEESSVSCKTYLTALAVLAVLGRGLLGDDSQCLLEELFLLPDAIRRYLSNWQQKVNALVEYLQGVQFLLLAGRGASLAAVDSGALIIKEAAHFPAEGMSSAALRHGPLNMASTRVFALIYAGFGEASQLNARLVADFQAADGRAALVQVREGQDTFSLPPVPASGLALLEILPAQMLSLALAQFTGWEAGRFAHTSKITEVE